MSDVLDIYSIVLVDILDISVFEEFFTVPKAPACFEVKSCLLVSDIICWSFFINIYMISSILSSFSHFLLFVVWKSFY